MANVRVNFSLKIGDGVDTYFVLVGGKELTWTSDSAGYVMLEGGQRHIVVFWFEGAPKSTLGIEGKTGGKAVVIIKESKIPDDEFSNAGRRRFSV